MIAAMALRNGAVLLMICVLWAVPLSAKDVLEGPVTAQVLRVIDGDTIEVAAHLWLGQTLITQVRLDGVDTPEIGQPECPEERAKGHVAKQFIIARLEGTEVKLRDIHYGKFAGHVTIPCLVCGPSGSLTGTKSTSALSASIECLSKVIL